MKVCEGIRVALSEGVKDTIKSNYGIDDNAFEKAKPEHSVCSIAKTKKGWVGFSHRTSYEFKIGDMLFDPEWDDEGRLSEKDVDRLKFSKRGKIKIKTMEQAKQASINFAGYVS